MLIKPPINWKISIDITDNHKYIVMAGLTYHPINMLLKTKQHLKMFQKTHKKSTIFALSLFDYATNKKFMEG